ncbi:MAG: iron-sulfur cluster assembly accessory protein [Bacteroidetes bacterium]|nr:MAG: iron-sulfur cluster assembly accessory protein [Bacteroidota bacterium]
MRKNNQKEHNMELPLHISPKAWEKIHAIRTQKNISPAYALRLGMRGSGCSGQFFVGFDTPKPEDTIFALPVGEVIINKAQLLYFYTVSLEWVETDEKSGFVFVNQ